MTAYKLVKVDAPIWGIGWKLEQTVIQVSSYFSTRAIGVMVVFTWWKAASRGGFGTRNRRAITTFERPFYTLHSLQALSCCPWHKVSGAAEACNSEPIIVRDRGPVVRMIVSPYIYWAQGPVSAHAVVSSAGLGSLLCVAPQERKSVLPKSSIRLGRLESRT
jgi:hypothetical protein